VGFFIQELKMPNITIDDNEFDLDSLSNEAKSQLQMIQICDQELGRLNAQLAIAQTARMAYSKALQEALPTLPAGDTVKLN
jgi:Family of unknown function (DUF6447)